MPDPVGTADERNFAWTGVMRAAGHLLVDRLERCGVDMNDNFVVARDRFWELVTSRRFPELVHNGGIHKWFLAALFLSLGLYGRFINSVSWRL
jgi:hypothetical protein